MRDPDDEEVQILSRSSSPTELLLGPLQLYGIMIWLGLTRFRSEESAILIAAIGIGDGIAPWIGKEFGRHLYHMPFAQPKTMEGSVVGVFLGTVVGCYFFYWVFQIPFLPLRIFLAYAAIAAVVEGTAPSHMDNLLVAVVLHLSIDRVQAWLPS